jgi:hypothetical protein
MDDMIPVPSQVNLRPHKDHIIQTSSAALCKLLLKHFNGFAFGDLIGDYTYANALKLEPGEPPILANPMNDQGAHMNEIHTQEFTDEETGEKVAHICRAAVLSFQKELIYWVFCTNSAK